MVLVAYITKVKCGPRPRSCTANAISSTLTAVPNARRLSGCALNVTFCVLRNVLVSWQIWPFSAIHLGLKMDQSASFHSISPLILVRE